MGNDPTITQRLDDEIKSCCMPQHDPVRGTTDDLLRDLHRVVTGNGSFNKGLIYKVALANAGIGDLTSKVEKMGTKLEEQVTRCNEIQDAHAKAKARRDGEKITAKLIGKAIWDNKGLVLMFVLALAIFILNWANHSSPQNSASEKKVTEAAKTVAIK